MRRYATDRVTFMPSLLSINRKHLIFSAFTGIFLYLEWIKGKAIFMKTTTSKAVQQPTDTDHNKSQAQALIQDRRPEKATQTKLLSGIRQNPQVREGKAIQRMVNGRAMKSPYTPLQAKGVVQRDTPAERVIADNPDYPVDNDFALIGQDSDKNGSPLAVELQYCVDHDMQMPATLAQFLAETGERWGPGINDYWMDLMTQSDKIFVLTHDYIAGFLNRGEAAFKNEAKRMGKKGNEGTWKEVRTLLDKGYQWYGRAGVFLPPQLQPEAYDQWVARRAEASEEVGDRKD